MLKPFFAAAVVLAAFAAPSAALAADNKNCIVTHAIDFKPGGKAWTVEAASFGPDCKRAVILLTMRQEGGLAVFTNVAATDGMHFMDVEDNNPETMKKSLAAFLDQSGSALKTTADLKPWKAGAEAPEPSGEFDFYPHADMNQEWYEELRAKKLPLFCYVPGLESLHCVAVDPSVDQAIPMGAQAFPG